MHITTFASGSSGNCALVSAAGTKILVDAGISLRRINTFLRAEGLAPEELVGVLITHEHSDHVSGLEMLLKHHNVDIYAPRTVASRLAGMKPTTEGRIKIIEAGVPFDLKGVKVMAFHTPHDTPESVGYRFDSVSGSLGLCTDLGHASDEVLRAMEGVDTALIESNHDEEMLRYGPYPVYLKRRILSDRGHLSNESCGELAVHLARSGTERIVLGHLSRENNTPERAFRVVSTALSAHDCDTELCVAPPLGAMTAEVRAKCSA